MILIVWEETPNNEAVDTPHYTTADTAMVEI
jgi:hypothetical protein